MSIETTPAPAAAPKAPMTHPDGRGGLLLTSSQTVGPYLAIGLTWPNGSDVVPPGAAGAVVVRGRLLDGEGTPVPDGMVETWQADPDGRFASDQDPRGSSTYAAVEGFRGYGRAATAADGTWWIRTLKPGPVPDGEGALQAPHLDVSVFARGLLDRVVTRIYFADEAEANATDPVLASVAEPRRGTLLAVRGDSGLEVGDASADEAPVPELGPNEVAPVLPAQPVAADAGLPVYTLDLRLQGDGETVFFAL